MPALEVTLAGALSFRRGDLRVGDRGFGARQLRLVTAMLLVERPGPVSATSLAQELWPSGSPPEQWRAGLRGLVSQVRRRLADVGLDGDLIVGEQGRYLVLIDDMRIDIEQAHVQVDQAQAGLADGEVEHAAALASAGRSVLSRPVLAGVDSPWVDQLRDRAAGQHIEALVVLGACRSRTGAHAQARSVLSEAVGLDPLREDAWRTLMRAEVAAGNEARALAAYDDCRRHLAHELGADPAEETKQLHAEILQLGPAQAVAALPATDDVVRPPGSRARLEVAPYVGLRAFRYDDADRFFGRDAEVQALVDRLARNGIVAVVGASGVGKSSLVRAGLLPALAQGAIPDSDTWLTMVMAPGAQPVKTLVSELVALGTPVGKTDLADQFTADADALHVAAGQLLAAEPPSARALLVIDQFEELFTLGSTDQARRFVRLLEAATSRLDRRVSVVVTLRADFYDRAAQVAGIADVLSHSQFVVPPLDGGQVESVVLGPARRAGVTLEPGLLGRIVA
ncbi:MAG TPA: BTAD domain-containing putative transcriptional regulator, partial [Nitriliruptoraceae bacterium]|nr:BTAD domain-containing putative transcriptional regulator [Nitriliruptoraceae bacterium]